MKLKSIIWQKNSNFNMVIFFTEKTPLAYKIITSNMAEEIFEKKFKIFNARGILETVSKVLKLKGSSSLKKSIDLIGSNLLEFKIDSDQKQPRRLACGDEGVFNYTISSVKINDGVFRMETRDEDQIEEALNSIINMSNFAISEACSQILVTGESDQHSGVIIDGLSHSEIKELIERKSSLGSSFDYVIVDPNLNVGDLKLSSEGNLVVALNSLKKEDVDYSKFSIKVLSEEAPKKEAEAPAEGVGATKKVGRTVYTVYGHNVVNANGIYQQLNNQVRYMEAAA